jgi:hypothetical protein
MPRLTDSVKQALGEWWSLTYAAGYGGYTTTDTVVVANELAGQEGRSLTFSENGAIATLYGYARRMFNASQVVQGLRPQDVIIPEAVSTPPWARDEREQATLPIWHVHFNFTYSDDLGDVFTERKVSIFRMMLPDTIGELQDLVNSDAEALAGKYHVTLVNSEVMEIHSV